MNLQRVFAVAGASSLLFVSACVSTGRYDKAVADAQTANGEAKRMQEQLDLWRVKIAAGEGRERSLQTLVDEQTAIGARLRDALQKLGTDVDGLLKDVDAKSLAEARMRLKELRAAQIAAEKRAALYADLASRFKKMVDAGDLSVVIRGGRMMLRLPNDVLFDSGLVEIKPKGLTTLASVAEALVTIDRNFQVAGHTDDQPIALSTFPSNWELSTGRALAVTHYLLKQGVKPGKLSATGFGEFDPVAPNTTKAGKAKNRRIEIILQPQIEELVFIPGLVAEK